MLIPPPRPEHHRDRYKPRTKPEERERYSEVDEYLEPDLERFVPDLSDRDFDARMQRRIRDEIRYIEDEIARDAVDESLARQAGVVRSREKEVIRRVLSRETLDDGSEIRTYNTYPYTLIGGADGSVRTEDGELIEQRDGSEIRLGGGPPRLVYPKGRK